MKMNSAQIRQTLHQFEAQAIPAGQRIAAPAVSSEWRLFRAGDRRGSSCSIMKELSPALRRFGRALQSE